MDVRAFLQTCPPFDAVDDSTLEAVLTQTQIAFYAAGTSILDPSEGPSEFVYVVRVGAVELLDDGRVLDLLGPGEMFGQMSMLSGASPATEVRAQEDTLCYLVATAAMERVLATHEGLSFLTTSLRRRLTKALDASGERQTDAWRVRVGRLIRRAPITCEPSMTVRDAADLMSRSRISCLVISTPEGYGVLTDRDLRSRVLAPGLGGDTLVADVMSVPAVTIRVDTLASDALRTMLERGVHHLLILDEADGLVGVVTDSDLMGLERRTPFAIRSEIERAPDVAAATEAMRRLPLAVSELVSARADPVDVGHVVGVTVDALTRRLLDLALAELGPAPRPWAWLSLGSQARHEQALATDQDHAFAYGDGDDSGADAWFAALAERVTSGIEEAGIPRCRAEVGAFAAPWRRSLSGWVERFEGWMSDVGSEGAILTAIAFDFRRVAGTLDIEPQLDALLRTAPAHPAFLRNLASQAIAAHPPTGFLRDIVLQAKGEHAGTFDVKHGGLIAVTSIARVLALSVGSAEHRTLGRLRDATEGGALTAEDRDALGESFHLLWQIRLEHQCEQSRLGTPVDDFVDPMHLGPITRRSLREAFRAITRVQRTMATQFGIAVR